MARGQRAPFPGRSPQGGRRRYPVERAGSARNGRTQPEPRANGYGKPWKHRHGRCHGSRTRALRFRPFSWAGCRGGWGGAPLAGASRAYFGSVLEVAYGEDFLDVLVHEILHGFIEVSVVVVDVWLAVAVFVGFGVEHDFKIGVFHGFVDFLDAHVRHVGFAVGAVAGEHPRVRPP